jgi:hypothetical protein
MYMHLIQFLLASNHFQCEDYKWKCQDYSTDSDDYWTNKPDRVTSVCNEAASSCCEAADNFKVVTNHLDTSNQTVGLYNECKCDFWFRLCEDLREGVPCDYAAEYCCGDYKYRDGRTEAFDFLNSPLCYCDFFNYAKNELRHTLKPKALEVFDLSNNLLDSSVPAELGMLEGEYYTVFGITIFAAVS